MRRAGKIAGAGLTLMVAAAALLLLAGAPQRAHAASAASLSLSCAPIEIQASATATYTCLVSFDTVSPFSFGKPVDGVAVEVSTVLGSIAGTGGAKSTSTSCGTNGVTDSCPFGLIVTLDSGLVAGVNTVTAKMGAVTVTVQVVIQPAASSASSTPVAGITVDCGADVPAVEGNFVMCSVIFDGGGGGGSTVDGLELVATTVLGTWDASGKTTLAFQCGTVGVANSCGSLLTLKLNAGTVVGTTTVFVSGGGAVGTDIIEFKTATSTNAASKIVSSTLVNKAIGDRSPGFEPLVDSTSWSVLVQDAAGVNVGDVLVAFSTDFGRLDLATAASPCDATSPLGQTLILSTGSTTGEATILLCGGIGDGAYGGTTATVTAKVFGKAGMTTSTEVTISKKPEPADITATVSGALVTVAVGNDGIPAPDGTNVKFSVIPASDGQVINGCALLLDGAASTSVAVASGKAVTVLVTVSDSIEKCGTAINLYGSQQVTVSAPGVVAPAPVSAGPTAFTAPPPGGISQGIAGTADVQALIDAQTFAVLAVWQLDVPTQQFRVYIPGAPAFANTLSSLKASDVVVLVSK